MKQSVSSVGPTVGQDAQKKARAEVPRVALGWGECERAEGQRDDADAHTVGEEKETFHWRLCATHTNE